MKPSSREIKMRTARLDEQDEEVFTTRKSKLIEKSEIKNIEDLRNEVLKVFEGLINGTKTVMEAGAVAKLSETVISGVKAEMDYSRLTRTPANIAFLGGKKAGYALKLNQTEEDDE